MKRIKKSTQILIGIASLSMIAAYFLPIWKIMMWAPQYPEWLQMYIWINDITGDVDIINGLNHYIGMKHIKVEMFPEFGVMPYILGCIIAFGLFAAVSGRKVLAISFVVVLILAGIGGMGDFYIWGYDYGHNLDTTAAIKVPGMSYQPPLIGSKTLLNFVAYSAPASGGWALCIAGVTVILALLLDTRSGRKIKSIKKEP